MISVLVVDDQAIVRAGYASILHGEPDIRVGEAMLSPAITRRLIDSFSSGRLGLVPPAEDTLACLSAREIEVLTLLASGLSNVDISAALFVAPSTIKTHVNVIFRKLGVRDRVQATIFAYDTGLVQPGARHAT